VYSGMARGFEELCAGNPSDPVQVPAPVMIVRGE
jgi:hypothetical protein